MHPYIPHLLDDIAKAHRQDIHKELPALSLEEELEATDRWMEHDEPEQTFGYYCGLKVEDFPPADQLKTRDIQIVCKAFKKMLVSWNLNVEFPNALPSALYYYFLVNTLNEKTSIPEFGFITFDYCTGNAPACVFKEYCSCLKHWNEQEKDSYNISRDELPF